jgi:serine kinase of HPr protein (carbohydrate metabolism regulator)
MERQLLFMEKMKQNKEKTLNTSLKFKFNCNIVTQSSSHYKEMVRHTHMKNLSISKCSNIFDIMIYMFLAGLCVSNA